MPFDAVAPNDLPDDPDQLVRTIMADPFVRQRMTAAMQALVEAAWDGRTDPIDLARAAMDSPTMKAVVASLMAQWFSRRNRGFR